MRIKWADGWCRLSGLTVGADGGWRLPKRAEEMKRLQVYRSDGRTTASYYICLESTALLLPSPNLRSNRNFTGKKLNSLISNPNIPTRHIEDAPKLSKYSLKLRNRSAKRGTPLTQPLATATPDLPPSRLGKC